MVDIWRTDWTHPFEHGLVMDAHEPGGDPPMEIHRALTAIDQHMNWLRCDVRDALSRECPGYAQLQRTDTATIYEIPDGKWEEITNALRGTEFIERTFSGRIGITTQHVHRLHAERALIGNVGVETVLVCSIDHALD
jgi:hypothetical protein